MSKPKIVVLISGGGSNLQALIDAVQSEIVAAEISLVVSNRKAAHGLVRAGQADIPTLYFPLKPYKKAGRTRIEYDTDLGEMLAAQQPDLIILAGWMHILSAAFLNQFPQRVINLHPALPGMFAGTHAIERAYAAYQAGKIAYSGCMVHYAIPEVDAGEVIVQALVPIKPQDALEQFATRMHNTEHRTIVLATQIALDALS